MTATASETPARVRPGSTRPRPADDIAGLDDVALLARFLRRSGGDPGALAHRLLQRFGSLGALTTAENAELARIPGADADVCLELKMLRALAQRLARANAARRPVITSWTALQAYVRTVMAHRPREQFRVLYLDHRNNLIEDEMVAEGTVDHAPVYPREVVRRALEVSASSMVLVHNHPSGDPTPSRADIEMTRRVVDAARALDLQVHDHIVVGCEGTASFRSLGLM